MLVNLKTETGRRRHLAVCTTWWILATIGLMLVPSILGQADLPISGTVVTRDGQLISGVTVYGSLRKVCCPFKREATTTNEKGEFRLEQPGAVVHFRKENFQPKALVVTPGDSRVRVTMDLSTNDIKEVPVCGRSGRAEKQVGFGKYGLQFMVPKRAAKILGGKVDVDYVRYVIKPKAGKSYLELWFGLQTLSTTPDDELFVNSIEFKQRDLTVANIGVLGADSWGSSRNGGRWRWTAIIGQGGARYSEASPEDATLFDRIINSICTAPYPNR